MPARRTTTTAKKPQPKTPTKAAQKRPAVRSASKAPAPAKTVAKPAAAKRTAAPTTRKTVAPKTPRKQPLPADKIDEIVQSVMADPRNVFEKVKLEVTTIDMRMVKFEDIHSYSYEGGVLAIHHPPITETDSSAVRSATVTVEQITAIPLNRIYAIRVRRQTHTVTARNGKATGEKAAS